MYTFSVYIHLKQTKGQNNCFNEIYTAYKFYSLVASWAGLLRALFFGEKCATCVQFMECAGVRSICCVSIKYEFLFDKSRQISINIM